MDAFFASIEQRDNPALRGLPVIVGGDPHKRGVVATCSYEARKFGVHSAMPTSQAVKLCPDGVFIRPRFEAYKAASQQIREIFYRVTDLVEPLSLDEAYLDVTRNKLGEPSATRLAVQIKRWIFEETELTASAGVSFNKFLAKAASDWKKPDGLTVIPPEKAAAFIDQLPIRKFYGIGKVTEQKMLALGIRTGADLRRMEPHELTKRFGKAGEHFYRMAHCRDDRPVNPTRVRKSIGKETTLQEDILEPGEVESILSDLAGKVSDLLLQHKCLARTVTLKVRYKNFRTVTRSHTTDYPLQEKEDILREAASLLRKTDVGKEYVRLLGVTASNLLKE